LEQAGHWLSPFTILDHTRNFSKGKSISIFSDFTGHRRFDRTAKAAGQAPARIARSGLSATANHAQPVACIDVFAIAGLIYA
jgi:hypothetical protein